MTQSNTEALTICIARRLAMRYKENQQAAIVQTAARLLSGADDETKDSLMRLIAEIPGEKQEILNNYEKMILAA